jgi:hydrogenase expression/formation protein HypC
MAIPSRVIEVRGRSVSVECFGIVREASLAMMVEQVAVGDYVLLQSGRYVIEVVDRKRALETLAVMQDLLRGRDGRELEEQDLGLVCPESQ